MLILGLLGGVASGKSLVADQLKALGAEVLDGDKAGHQVLRQDEVKEAIRNRWGDAVFQTVDEENFDDEHSTETFQAFDPTPHVFDQVNRAALARIVFAPTPEGRAELAKLEQITHPRIKRLLERQLAEMRAREVCVAVLDAPVMIKAGWHKFCNVIMFVEATRELRLARAKTRGWDEAEFDRREAAQEPIEFKRSLAHVIIDNSDTREATELQVKRWWHSQFPS